MGDFAKWLLHEDRKELFDYLFAIVLNAVFLALTALLLWPLGKATMAFHLAKAYWIFWTGVIVVSCVLVLAQRIFRMDLYERYNAYVITGLIVSGFLQAGWSAFAAPLIHNAVAGTAIWLSVILYVVGLVSCWVAAVIVAAFYMGSIYRMVNLIIALLSYIVFSAWPAAGTRIYGWFFDLWSFDLF